MSRRTLLLLLLLLLVARGVLVLSIADVFFYGEELAKGTAAKALGDGLGVPAWKLVYVHHEGGGFLVTCLKTLLFDVLGPCVLAHKLLALATTAILLAVGYWMTCEHFGRVAGALFGLLFVLCPEAFMRFSLLSLGTHFEGLIGIALVLHYGARILFRETPARSDWAFLGVFSR